MCAGGRVVALPVVMLAASALLAGPEGKTAGVVERLALQRRDAARRTYETAWANYRDRRGSDDLLYRWSIRWLDAERQLSDRPSAQVAAFQRHWERMAELERLVRRVQRAGQATIDEISAAEFYRTEAELWLIQAREKK